MAGDVGKRLGGTPTQLGTTPATVYTAPASPSTTTTLKEIRVVNTGSNPATLTMSIGADAASSRIKPGVTIPAKGEHVDQCFLILNSGDSLQAYSDTASSLTLTLSGIETS